MGIVPHDQPFDDDYSRDIIQRCRDLSRDLDEYVVTQQYLVETQEENLTPLWLRNRLLVKLIGELNASGIFINFDTDDLLDQPLLVEAVLTLKAKFGEERLFQFLKDHQSLRNDINELIDDDCCSDIIELCSRTMPLDEGWESLVNVLADRPGIIRSTEAFIDLIKSVLERCDSLGDDPVAQDAEMDKLYDYTNYLSNRKDKIRKIAEVIYSSRDDGSTNADKVKIMDECMTRFESQLSRPGAIRGFIDGELDVKNFVDTRRQFFLSKWKHCLEFWTTTADPKALPSDIEAAILVATLYVDAPDPNHARLHVVETFDNLIDQFGDRYQAFREIIDRAIGNIAVVEGRLNNEIN